MGAIRGYIQDDQLVIDLSGHIDSSNSAQVEEEAMQLTKDNAGKQIVIDAEKLSYISSAGLRVLLRLRKTCGDLKIINVNSEVFEVLDMTGFTQMMSVEKAYRRVSVDGCEIIGQGANGIVYRIDGDNVVKVYRNADALEEIRHEREVARLALILGVPTAISYDVVRVGDSYGSVFELLDARSFSSILAEEPEKMGWCVKEFVDLLKKIHSISVPEGELPDMRETAIGWARFMEDHLPEKYGRKLLRLITDIPADDHMLHGDYHTNNLNLTGDEVLLIDMDTLSVGNPIFELASMYNAFIGYGEIESSRVSDFLGLPAETAAVFWRKTLEAYLGTDDGTLLKETEDKARVIGYARMIRRTIRRGGLESESALREIDHWKNELIELLDKTESLIIGQNEIEVEARRENLTRVLSFVEAHLEEVDCTVKEQMQITVATEEIFVNIASYAYKSGEGTAGIRFELTQEPPAVVITFTDRGVPYNPLEREEPDITLPAEEREVGGLGIFMVRKSMDEVRYDYKDGKNILTMKKLLSKAQE